MNNKTIPIRKRKVTRVGKNNWFHIQIVYVQNGLIDPKKKYDLICTEVKEDE